MKFLKNIFLRYGKWLARDYIMLLQQDLKRVEEDFKHKHSLLQLSHEAMFVRLCNEMLQKNWAGDEKDVKQLWIERRKMARENLKMCFSTWGMVDMREIYEMQEKFIEWYNKNILKDDSGEQDSKKV